MTNPSISDSPGELRDVQASLSAAASLRGARETAHKSSGSNATTPAFQALLDDLQARTRELERATAGADDPGRLERAVGAARASLDSADNLSASLLEAFRQVVQQSEAAQQTRSPRS